MTVSEFEKGFSFLRSFASFVRSFVRSLRFVAVTAAFAFALTAVIPSFCKPIFITVHCLHSLLLNVQCHRYAVH